MEYLTIVGFVMVLLIPLLVMFYNFRSESSDTIVSNQINQVGKKMTDTAETIYFLGEPSKTVIKTYIPAKVKSITIGNNELVFNISTRAGTDQMVFFSSVNITGTVSITEGQHNIRIESKGAYVEIADT